MTPQFLMTAPGEDPVVVESHFAATPERVFRAWTEPSDIKRWFGLKPPLVQHAEIDLRVGGAWRFSFGPGHVLCGEYRHIAPAKALTFTWRHEVRDEGGETRSSPDSEVHIVFTVANGGTHLRLVHRSLEAADTRVRVREGWAASLNRLDTVL